MAIESYRFGHVVIDGHAYSSDVIVWPGGVDDSWWRVEGHRLCGQDVAPLLDKGPEALVIGSGAQGLLKVDAGMLRYLAEHCCELHVERTRQACELYNELARQGRRVVAGLHLTC